jgi:hypothetical protein
MRIAWVLIVAVALLVPATSDAKGSKKEMRAVAKYLLGDLREDALTVGPRQKSVVAIKPDGCEAGCVVQAVLGEGTGSATSRPGKQLKLRVKLTKALRDKIRDSGRARAVLQLSVTDRETGAVVNIEREIPLRS